MIGSKALRSVALSFLFLLVALCGFSSRETAYAENNPTAYGSGYSAVLYDNTNGLPTSDVNAIAQTEEGFLWIGSYSGLIRYDGNSFYRYDSSVGVSSIVSLHVDAKDRLWIGTNDSGVFVLQHEVFRVYNDKDKLRSLSIRSMEEDGQGNLLIATTMGLSYIDANDVLHALDAPQINSEYVSELIRDNSGRVYGVTNNGAFFIIENLNVTAFYSSLAEGAVKTLYPDPQNEGYIYWGTDNASIVYGTLSDSLASRHVFSVSPHRNVRCIRKYGSELWVSSDDGIGYLNGENYVALDTLPMNNSVEKVFSDFEQNLWFTSTRQGLMKIVRNRFDQLATLAPRVVNSVYKQSGLYYIGTDDGLVLLDENRAPASNAASELLSSVRIRSVRGDSANRIWFGTGSMGIVCYDPSTDAVVSYNKTNGYLSHNHARVMLELSDGRIAVATKGGVDVLHLSDDVAEHYAAEQGVANPEILCLEEGPNGSILAGSDGGGIYVVGSGTVSHVGRNEGLSSEVVMRIKKDPKQADLFWIVTSNSIAYLTGGRVTTVTQFPYSNNFDLYFDAHDRIWVLSSNGIYVVQRNDMLRNEKIDYVFYDAADGLPSAATANSYSYLDEDGTLYIAASKIGSTDLNRDYDLDKSIRLRVPYVLADDKYLPVKNGKVTLPSDCKRLVINAYAFTYSLNNPLVTYRLEGFDENATSVFRRDLKPVTYTNLAGGEYKFVMSIGTGDPLTIVITKQKTVFEHAWFWVIIAILAAGLIAVVVFLIFHVKMKKLRQKQARDSEFINEITDVFASCIDLKDPYTNGHSHRVAKFTAMIAERMGKSKEDVEKYYRIALLHDIGKIAIPDRILNKPERLTDEEFAVMKSHSQRGYDILKGVTIVPDLAVGAGYHHERVDGRGYPNGLTQDEIPFVAQIIAVADTFDAMYSNRPYRKSLTIEQVAAELQRCAGTQLNADVVNVLLSLIKEGAIGESDR